MRFDYYNLFRVCTFLIIHIILIANIMFDMLLPTLDLYVLSLEESRVSKLFPKMALLACNVVVLENSGMDV